MFWIYFMFSFLSMLFRSNRVIRYFLAFNKHFSTIILFHRDWIVMGISKPVWSNFCDLQNKNMQHYAKRSFFPSFFLWDCYFVNEKWMSFNFLVRKVIMLIWTVVRSFMYEQHGVESTWLIKSWVRSRQLESASRTVFIHLVLSPWLWTVC